MKKLIATIVATIIGVMTMTAYAVDYDYFKVEGYEIGVTDEFINEDGIYEIDTEYGDHWMIKLLIDDLDGYEFDYKVYYDGKLYEYNTNNNVNDRVDMLSFYYSVALCIATYDGMEL